MICQFPVRSIPKKLSPGSLHEDILLQPLNMRLGQESALQMLLSIEIFILSL